MASFKMNHPENCGIPEFYAEKSVFLTGFTGFLGSCVAEKLLRSCPRIKNIYVLIRSKKGLDPQTRLENLLKSPLFDKLREFTRSNETETETEVDPFSKLVPILGDLTAPSLGLSPEDAALLLSQVSIVIHSGATVKFDDSLKVAMKINVEGTANLLELAGGMRNLQAFVYVSTAYSNWERREIDEVVYPLQADPLAVSKFINSISDELANSITPKLLGTKPNTYTFSKHLAEILVQEAREKDGIPACIIRPSVVTATEKDPFPGWVDNLNGASGPLIAACIGMLRSILCFATCRGDLIPVDYVVDVTIASAWATSAVQTNRNTTNMLQTSKDISEMPIPVYNCCSSTDNPITWNDFLYQCSEAAWVHPFGQTVWYPEVKYLTTASPTFDNVRQFLFHRLPFTLIDIVIRIFGGKPIFLRMHKKIRTAQVNLHCFTTKDWNFSTTNTRWLLSQLDDRDRTAFNFDVKEINWKEYNWNYIIGLGKYVMHQSEDDTKRARKKIKIFYVCHRVVQITAITCLCLSVKHFIKFPSPERLSTLFVSFKAQQMTYDIRSLCNF